MLALLFAAASVGAVSGCELIVKAYFSDACNFGTEKVLDGSTAGVCRYAAGARSDTIWQCEKDGSVSMTYYSDDTCSSSKGTVSFAPGDECVFDAQTGYYVTIGGNCCGFAEEKKAAEKKHSIMDKAALLTGAKKAHKREVARMVEKMKGQKSDTADLVKGVSKAHKRFAERMVRKVKAEESDMPGSDNADEIHYQAEEAKDSLMAKMMAMKEKKGRLSKHSGLKDRLGAMFGAGHSHHSRRHHHRAPPQSVHPEHDEHRDHVEPANHRDHIGRPIIN